MALDTVAKGVLTPPGILKLRLPASLPRARGCGAACDLRQRVGLQPDDPSGGDGGAGETARNARPTGFLQDPGWKRDLVLRDRPPSARAFMNGRDGIRAHLGRVW